MDLNIKYKNGSMVVHLDELLKGQTINKFKRLIKLIEESHSPDDIVKVRVFIEQGIEQFELIQKKAEKSIIAYESKVNFCQKQIENCTFNRDTFKRDSDGWNHYNFYVKRFSQEMKELKVLLRSSKAECNRCIKGKKFYLKCLENIS